MSGIVSTIHLTGSENNSLSATCFSPASEHTHPPVILMHGGGQTRHAWEATSQRLAARGFLAVSVDARGHGDSEWVKSANYTFHHYAADLTELTRQVGATYGNGKHQPILVGASMGGISAMMAQHSQETDLFSAIVLVDITPRMEASGVERIMGFMSQNMRSGFESVEAAANAIAAYLPGRKRPKSLDGLSKNLRLRDDGRYYWHWDPAFVESKNNIMVMDHDDPQHAFEVAASSISVPTLLIRGSKSELVTKQAADDFIKLVPHASYVDITDAGHMVAGDRNDVFAHEVISFLEKQTQSI